MEWIIKKFGLSVIILFILKIVLYKIIENYYNLNILGIKNIPKKNGYVIISNHNFSMDSFIIKKIFNNNFNIIVEESLRKKILNYDFDIIYYRKEPQHIKKSGEQVKKSILKKCKYENKNIAIFPEGYWSNPDELKKFKKGLFYLCYENKIPILPIIMCIKRKPEYGDKPLFMCLDKNIKVKIFKIVNSEEFNNFEEYYNHIYNKMNNYIKKYTSDQKNNYNYFIHI